MFKEITKGVVMQNWSKLLSTKNKFLMHSKIAVFVIHVQICATEKRTQTESICENIRSGPYYVCSSLLDGTLDLVFSRSRKWKLALIAPRAAVFLSYSSPLLSFINSSFIYMYTYLQHPR